MKILVAGATGALGSRVLPKLVELGHSVVGLTRSESKGQAVKGEGADVVIGDVLDRRRMDEVIDQTRPDAIVQLLNALPKRGPMRPKEIDATNELRVTGTRNLLDAAIRHGTRRYIAESMIFGYGYGDVSNGKVTEEDKFPVDAPWPALAPALDALGFLESRVLSASERGEIEGIALRFGLFYGPRVGSTEFMAKMLKRRMLPLPGGASGVTSWIHIEDAADATVAAVESSVGGEVFNVVDDEPGSFGDHLRAMASILDNPSPYNVPRFVGRLGGRYAALMSRTNLRVSNDKIKAALDWRPRYPSFRQGLATLAS
jgi:nucleoside-diphosphate-sugar epimerase